jgi:hypothetical protein
LSDVDDKIKEMAKLTMLSNKLNDIQLKNLKSFPFIYFDGINELVMEYDLSNNLDVDTEENSKLVDIKYQFGTTTGHLHVTYKMKIEPYLEKMNHLEKRFEHLETSVRTILWKDVKVRVFFNDKLVFESKKNGK